MHHAILHPPFGDNSPLLGHVQFVQFQKLYLGPVLSSPLHSKFSKSTRQQKGKLKISWSQVAFGHNSLTHTLKIAFSRLKEVRIRGIFCE